MGARGLPEAVAGAPAKGAAEDESSVVRPQAATPRERVAVAAIAVKAVKAARRGVVMVLVPLAA
jgi:hypothetical protein